jgi:DNA-binding transcriptional ArsR family regulator
LINEEIKKSFPEFLKVLADQTRLEILYSLKEKKMTQAGLVKKLAHSGLNYGKELAQSTISQHLSKLKSFDLIDSELKDNVNYYKVKEPEIFEMLYSFQVLMLKLNKDKFSGLNDFDRLDTLF